MSQLGFTFYPKDWWASDSFYALNPFERYIFLELLFMMYVNDGFVANDRINVERRLQTAIKESVWSKITDLLVKDGDQLTHKSVNARLRKTLANRENGLKGGRPKKETKNPKNPDQKPKQNPPSEKNRIEEKENRIEEPLQTEIKMDDYKKYPVDDLYKSYIEGPGYQAAREALCISRRITPDQLTKFCQQFTMHLKSTAKLETHMREFITHFNNWLHKQDLTVKPERNEWQETIERQRAKLANG